MHNFNVAVVHCSYMFRLPQSNFLLTVYQKCKKEIILHVVSGRDLSSTEGIAYIGICVCYL